MRSLLTEIDKIGVQVLVKNGQVNIDPEQGFPEQDLSLHRQQFKDLLTNRLPLESNTGTSSDPKALEGTNFPLTDIQYAYLIGRNPGLELGGRSSSLYLEWDIKTMDLARLNHALNQVIQLHPALRTVVTAGGQQSVLPEVDAYEIAFQDASDLTLHEQEAQLSRTRNEMENTVLSVEKVPSMDIRVTQTSQDRMRLHFNFDLMFMDMHSVQLVLRDWQQFYEHGSVQHSAQPSFQAYLKEERSLQGNPQGLRDQQYWTEQLERLPMSPELPLKTSPELLSRPKFNRLSIEIKPNHLTQIQKAANRFGITLESVFLGAYTEVIRQWSKRQNFTITLTQLGRRPYFDNIESCVGNFLQPMLFGVTSQKEQSLTERFTQLQTDLFMHRLHASYNGVQVLRDLTAQRGENRAASAPVVFSNTLDANLEDVVKGFKWEGATQVYSSNQTPQLWLENQLTLVDGVLNVNWNFIDGLFPDGMIQVMFEAYEKLLHEVATQEAIWEQTGSVVQLPLSDFNARVLANNTVTDIPPKLLHHLILDAAVQSPDSIAIIQGDQQMSYAELVELASRVAARIQEEVPVESGDMIAVSIPQSPELIVGILGILMAGAAYVAIDPTLPAQRREKLMQRCQSKCVVSMSDALPTDEASNERLRIDIDAPQTLSYPSEVHSPEQHVDELAYVIFTSGSTGEPKGVMISHRNASNTVQDINQKFQVTKDDAVFSIAPAGFDLSVYDYFGVLGAGGRVVFQPSESPQDMQAWCNTLTDHHVTIWNSVPAPVKALVDRCGAELVNTQLRLILMSGDWIPVDLPERTRESLPDVSIISLGGATEGSIWSIYYPIQQVEAQWTSIPYGKPLANQKFHVFNDWMSPSPKWVTGELYIAGVGVAQGYLADPEKTNLRFFDHPETGERLYKTGDLGRYTEDGVIEILGREDNQVKINGYRVELGEIEACLLDHEQTCHVVMDAPMHPKTGQRHIVAYILPEESNEAVNEDVLQTQLKDIVQDKLPSYMLPSYYVFLSHMPLTSNGKIDRAGLPTPWPEGGVERGGRVEPENDIQRKLLQIWCDQLEHDDFDVTSGFFDIGGDSLHAVALLGALREAFDVTPAQEQDMIEGLFMNASIQTFSQIIEALVESESAEAKLAEVV
ncbi:non-ribosomal peptide synthetase [Algicola sagamiensis]|uniref:non-ribosomal peptide synthetase n=1 Tax=Algicola sagamiensis TaxID=163869 RepID=UPI0003771ECD|nr:non-ribosomal peptide synthetase [Algicola sagamiensis]